MFSHPKSRALCCCHVHRKNETIAATAAAAAARSSSNSKPSNLGNKQSSLSPASRTTPDPIPRQHRSHPTHHHRRCHCRSEALLLALVELASRRVDEGSQASYLFSACSRRIANARKKEVTPGLESTAHRRKFLLGGLPAQRQRLRPDS